MVGGDAIEDKIYERRGDGDHLGSTLLSPRQSDLRLPSLRIAKIPTYCGASDLRTLSFFFLPSASSSAQTTASYQPK
jgi:hypothetical protein